MDLEQAALAGIRPAELEATTDAELQWLWRKLEQWHGMAKSRGENTARHETAAGLVLQAAACRGVDLDDNGLTTPARARCSLAQRVGLLPDRVMVSEGHVELCCCDEGLQLVQPGGQDDCLELAAAALDEAGIPAALAVHGPQPGDTAVPLYDLALVRAEPRTKDAPAPKYPTHAEAHGGAMVSVAVPGVVRDALDAAGLLSGPGAEPDNLHVTLLYMGRSEDLESAARDAIVERVTAVCQEHRSLRALISGVGHFAAGPDGVPGPLLVSAPGLSLLQADLERAVGGVIDLPQVHGWVPHVTLGYWPAERPPDLQLPADLDLPHWAIHNVEVWTGGELLAVCPLAGRDPRRSPGWAEPLEPAEPEITALAQAITCSTDDRRIIYYLVSEPGTVDAHGHRIDAETIEDALHGYMASAREVKLEHGKDQGLVHELGRRSIAGKAVVVEGFVAPCELPEFHGAKPPDGPIAKGSSVVAIHYTDQTLWEQLKATDHGISWGGYARKVQR